MSNNKFTIEELGIIHTCLTNEIQARIDAGNEGTVNMLEHIADKCIKARIDAGYKFTPTHFNDLRSSTHEKN